MLLSHSDDVADHELFAKKFGCQRMMHAADGARRLGLEQIIDGEEELRLDDDLVVIPTPGHTAGHMVLLVDERFLFTGDHLYFNRVRERLSASEDYCWHSWPQQIESMARLLQYRFDWVLPGHGQAVHLPTDVMHDQLAALVARMRGAAKR